MLKQVFQQKDFLISYGSLWAISGFLFFLLLHLDQGLPAGIALTDSLLSSLILAVFMLSLWFIVRYSDGDQVLGQRIILHALAALVLIISIWLLVAVALMGLMFPSRDYYQVFLQHSYILRAFYGILMGGVVFFMMFTANLLRASQEAARRESSLKELVQQTELQALKNQLNPHFIYNSLNSISSLTITSPEKAQTMVIRLSEFLRYALGQDASQLTSLKEELENSRLYLQIEKVRFGERLCYEFHIPEEHLKCRLPVMILQPLFENAVKHGIQRSSAAGSIILSSQETRQGIRLSLSNPFDPAFDRFRGEGVGLENIRNRLRLIYGNGQLLQVQANQGVFMASLDLPQAD